MHALAEAGYRRLVLSVDFNYEQWQNRYNWEDRGDEWSVQWGGTDAEWSYGIFPRVAAFLPAASLLEIAPGFGRWSQYLLPRCTSYLGVDLAERCAVACQERFKGYEHARFAVNDGSSLPMVGDDSVDFVFSFDSLVHCEADVIGAYLKEIGRVLRADGVAFIHHSNAGVYRMRGVVRDCLYRIEKAVPRTGPVRNVLLALPVKAKTATLYRSHSMTAARFYELSCGAGLSCIGQEVINWTSPSLTDCISIVTRPGSKWDRPNVQVTNRHFQASASSAAAAAQIFRP